MKAETFPRWRQMNQRRWALIGAVALVLLLGAATALYFALGRDENRTPRLSSTAHSTITTRIPLNLPPPDLLRPITPEEALKENTERAFSGRPDTAAAAFILKTTDANRERALECLTQAVYYEAASEGADGQRAVAQIVLNRMRHPAYPNTVCGVVYQGSERQTGCQFTFTCDGSLTRPPVQSLWKQAQRIATEALKGKVFAPAGHATHYHADYVLPYWADSLDKSAQIGRHIFYRLKGNLGATRAFSQRYGGLEPLPPPPSAVEVALEDLATAGPEVTVPAIETGLSVAAGELVTTAQPKPELVADALGGTLVVDSQAPKPPAPAASRKSELADSCAGSSGPKLQPMTANDVRASGDKGGC